MKPIQHAACLCALSALLALSPAVALCENTPAENQQAEDDRLQTGKQANLRKLPNKKSDKLETLKKRQRADRHLRQRDQRRKLGVCAHPKRPRWLYPLRAARARAHPTPEPTATPDPPRLPQVPATPEPGSETPAPTAEPSGVKDEIAYDEPRPRPHDQARQPAQSPPVPALGKSPPTPPLTVVGEVEKDGELWLHVERARITGRAICSRAGASGEARRADPDHGGRGARAVPGHRARPHRGYQKRDSLHLYGGGAGAVSHAGRRRPQRRRAGAAQAALRAGLLHQAEREPAVCRIHRRRHRDVPGRLRFGGNRRRRSVHAGAAL